ncbi:hypothetical protein [uncultured Methanolobus sp.]|uniref:hypothetical protein n=1 Tax=uncultured Methanolobus sp. TaxID=218300 RepID=UPI0029C66530|nr:hypothetical protein [uncultured Methanolobus sp.]
METKTLDKRLKALEQREEASKNTIYIYDPVLGVPENIDSSYVFFLPDNGREV